MEVSIGHCLECKIPMVVFNGRVQQPENEPDAALYFDIDPTHSQRRVTWHKPGCANLCTSGLT